MLQKITLAQFPIYIGQKRADLKLLFMGTYVIKLKISKGTPSARFRTAGQ